MYAYISGSLEKMGTDHVVVEVSGIGYEIRVSGRNLGQIGSVGDRVKLFTSFQVREDSQTLYGFLTEEEKALFLSLITVSGIGPRSAMAILDRMTPDELAEAVLTGNARAIAKANGVGLKGAEKVILELKDKIALPSFMEGAGGKASASSGSSAAVVEVLTTLGYSATEAGAAVRKVKDKDQKTEEQILKEALKHL